jgi:glycosyltransferase involved in cell wall biosynthesis
MYSGNLGRAHDYSAILAAMRKLRDDTRIRWVMIGAGVGMENLRKACEAEGHLNVAFMAHVKREQLDEALSAADVHLVSLLPELEGLIVPSKLYGVLAVGRPLIYVGAKTGEIAKLMTANECGLCVEPGDGEGLATQVRTLASRRDLLSQMGENSRRLSGRFQFAIAFKRWQRLIEHEL